MALIDELVESARRWTDDRFEGPRPLRPSRALAVVACMDSRMDIFGILGLHSGEAHIIRNAGGVVSDDVIRSLVLSQRFMGTRTVVLLHHTDCGLMRVREDALRQELEEETGVRPSWAFDTFNDPYANVRQCIRRVQLSPFVASKDDIYGFVYDVDTGELNRVASE